MKKLLTATLLMSIGFIAAYFLLTQTPFGLEKVSANLYSKNILPDASLYKGQVDDKGLFTGKGKLTWPDGKQYIGQFEQGMMHGKGKLILATGDVYAGDFTQGQMQGHGSWVLANSSKYKGDIHNGLYHGKGELVTEDGAKYTGDFTKGEFHGEGVYISNDRETYSGDFVNGDFEGKGSYSSEGYGNLIGEFKNWTADGEGFRTDEEGNQWRGEFSDSVFTGTGEYTDINGNHYKGEFAYDAYDGEGKLVDKEGNIYIGQFKYGQKHGEGTFEYAEALDGIKKFSGQWKHGVLVKGDNSLKIYSAEKIAEQAMYQQQRLLAETLAKVQKSDSEAPQLYLLGIAGWGPQEVFRREINFIETQFKNLYDMEGKSAFLINSQRAIEERPMATLTSIKQSIQHFSNVMDKEKDILFLYASSHGGKKSGFSLGHKGIALEDLLPSHLKTLLDNSGIKHKVIIISACYSGTFIEPLKNETSLIITAASKNNTSFGCGDDRLFTYFGKAYFEQSLPKSDSFIEAFEKSNKLISAWEQEKDLTASKPQIASAKGIEKQLNKWRQSMAKKTLVHEAEAITTSSAALK
ncbi:MAG: caspase family protein [Pseudomonadales bacterium]|nr:caspase family protein [Pseudomonadales bacterium]